MRSRIVAMAGALAFLWAASAPGQNQGQSGAAQADAGRPVARLETATREPYGQYLTDGEGRALYVFMKDEQGRPESNCYDACARAWPPAIAGQADVAAGEPVKQAMLGTITRKDGSRQLTYNGRPLYFFIKDRGPGEATGQDVKGFGAEWYLVAPDGSVNRKHG